MEAQYPNHCSECVNFMRGYTDTSTGNHEPDECRAIDRLGIDGQITEETAVVLTGIMFTLSTLAGRRVIERCPSWSDKWTN